MEGPSLQFIPMVNKFPKAFLDDLPGVPPDRDIDFGIELLLSTHPISVPLYRMDPTKFRKFDK